jgi:predicted acetyltransferase
VTGAPDSVGAAAGAAAGPAVREVPERDRPQLAALSAEAFGGPPDERWAATLAHSTSFGAYDGDRVVSHARVKPYRQWFGGREVPMGGVASVAVTASHQRRGLAKATVAATLPWMRANGFVVSTLFPATSGLYRALGWEHAGDYTWVDVPGAALRALGPADGLRPATAADLPGMFAAYRRLCAETNGMLVREGPFFDLRPESVLGGLAVVAERDGRIEGYALGERRHAGHEVEVTAWDVVGTTAEAERAVWFALGAGASVVRTVRAKAFPDTLLLHLGEPAVTPREHLRWMLRVVDAPGAVAARGWPRGLAVRVDLRLDDPQVPENDGPWRLVLDAGDARLEPGGAGTVRLDAGAFAALYASYADPRALRRAGRLACADEAALDALAAATAGPSPRLLDYF